KMTEDKMFAVVLSNQTIGVDELIELGHILGVID
ncbi:unnamed protein product, partial [marine sediment metagenome]